MSETPVPLNFKQYVDYIRNTGRIPLPVAMFDEDWEPIGPMVRSQMEKAGLIYIYGPDAPFYNPTKGEGIRLRPDLEVEEPRNV